VFLCAVVPEPGRSFEAIQAEKERFCSEGPLPTVSGPAGAAVAPVPPPEVTARLFYGDCPPELAAWAHARLRPQSTRPLSEPSAVTGPPPGPVTVITCTDDPLTPPVWQRHRATTVLGGAPVVELAGGHSPFLSRPAALAEVLAGVVSATGC
jgi:pimeloyl-ACP methyl ester carboxylesterase